MTVSLTCPHCRAEVRATPPKPGRFRVSCRACGGAFAVRVPEDSFTLASSRRGGSAVAEAPTVAAPQVQVAPETVDSLAGVEATPRPAAKIPAGVPGYRFERALGRGGMGTVYLARQLSLDRPVAIKVMARKWACDPVFVARFTREAFAAALLNHPNVVQIYDIGESGDLRYFSMEYVPGRTLAEHLKAEGKLDGETAVGYVLQAARGLAHAHDRGMIHRDVKPDNLLLDDEGRVKVADLGLVKTPGLHEEPTATHPTLGDRPLEMTGHRTALGTPAYMAPEQCRDAAGVDHRADIYSLGCTLYVLVTGRPPFDGTTAVELMTKHAYEPIVPPDEVVGRVPKEVSAIVLKMLAKDARDRYQTMAEVIRTLEQWLGVRHAGTFNPRDGQIDQLEAFAAEYHAAPSAVLKSRVIAWSLGGCFLLTVLMLFFGQLALAFGLAGFVLQSTLAYFVLTGARAGSHLFRRARAAALGLALWDYALVGAGVALFVLLLWGLKLLAVWAGFGALAAAAAGAVQLVFDAPAAGERAACLAGCRKLLRRMRLDGQSEDDLRHFVAKYAGRRWEEFFEALFGYEAKLAARATLARGHHAGEKFAAWREPLLAALDRFEAGRRAAAERKFLARVESAGLAAAGLSSSQAHARAASQAHALVTRADLVRGGGTVPDLRQLLGEPGPIITPRRRPGPGERLATAATGMLVRSLGAGLLIGLFAAWCHQNFAASRLPDTLSAAVELGRPTEALAIQGVPVRFTAWVDGATVGWAGFLLLASFGSRGPKAGALVLLGAAVCALGPTWGIRTADPVQPAHVAFLLGSVFALVGYRVGER